MLIREYVLPPGWFPHEPDEVKAVISRYLKGFTQLSSSRAAISPHAGWYYSGYFSALAISSLQKKADTVVVIGGHLPGSSPALFAMEDAVRTPFGPMHIDTELRSAINDALNGQEDKYKDNTVEVLIPMVRYFFPDSRLVWMRLPENMSSYDAGKTISMLSAKLKRNVNVIGSTDLTHYGPNYGFVPKGTGKKALEWVIDVNDAAFIGAVTSASPDEVLRCAQMEYSACSAGAVLAAMGFAQAEGLPKARLLEYGTSADVSGDVPDSFVGYAALSF